jgi:hypothetical protein
MVAFCLQDSRTPRAESDDGTQSRCRVWTYVSSLLPGLTFMYSRADHCSNANAFPQSRSRIQRHGWQGADHRMARRKRANDFPAIADGVALIIYLISQNFPRLLNLRSFYILSHMFSYHLTVFVSIMCYYHTFLSFHRIPLFFGLI